ncbi:stage V sporulation protein D [Pseudogracilibacillus auburnensis]|uniref:serine-type D-Ala-D-Ala carboxypeptidase n=1 Tax=Pseudogracilibacillus auburnensis TaxID=1494959 RepID=A0A2V3W5P7_9BACI|nr:stage V sporulation protein D [Pseudogracilibacillus auburnensis]PXW88514.1 stage V sporulation protein D (sporulation-specific penicillin-binding protein) [Pseudogracilibacillus auburnensis]
MKHVSTIVIKKRMIIALSLFAFVITVIIGRLGYVQFVIGQDITEKATESWLRDITFQADRGNILDVHGNPLTENISAPSVIVIPRQINDKQQVSEHLASILQMPVKDAYEYVTKNASSVRIHPKGRKITKEQEEQLVELNLNGVYLAKDSKRFYPYDDYLSHVLGFTGIDNQGLMGLEMEYDEKLKGTNGSLSYYSDAKGKKITDSSNVYIPPKDGLHLKTTIDLNIQTIMERELNLAQIKYNPDGAIAIAVDPKTGGVLAMSSRPNFHPDKYKKVDAHIFDRNLPIWSTFEPGSTFKIITLAAALEEKQIDLKNDTFFDPGYIKVGGAKLRCWKAGGHGSQTMLEVVENSCNPGFVHIGQKLGDKKLFPYIRKFGFGSKTGIDLQGEGSGILFKPEQVGPVELATTSFGQGVSVTPIQQVMAVAATINGGYLYEPYIAKEWIDPLTNEVVEQIEPNLKERVISESTSKQMREALESVVANGTGRPAYVDGYRVGGKTGTAQKVGPDGRYMANNHVVSFIGFAPADDPQIVVLVAIDNPKNTVQFGGVVAAPIVGTMIEDSLRVMNVPIRKDGLDKKYTWPDQPKVEVPDLIGLTREDLLHDMSNFDIEVHGDGDYIIDQSPEAGIKMDEGATIRIYLSNKIDRENN